LAHMSSAPPKTYERDLPTSRAWRRTPHRNDRTRPQDDGTAGSGVASVLALAYLRTRDGRAFLLILRPPRIADSSRTTRRHHYPPPSKGELVWQKLAPERCWPSLYWLFRRARLPKHGNPTPYRVRFCTRFR